VFRPAAWAVLRPRDLVAGRADIGSWLVIDKHELGQPEWLLQASQRG